MKLFKASIWALYFLSCFAYAKDFAEIDNINSIGSNYSFNVVVEENKFEYKVNINQRENSLVDTLSPEKDRGKKFLARGTNMWVFLPNVNKSIRISPQQRLIGAVSNIDIARTVFGIDYKMISEKKEKGALVFELEAVSKSNPYNKAVLWVNEATEEYIKAEFFTLTGALAKVISYYDYKPIMGKSISTRKVIQDILTKQKSTLIYKDFSTESLSENFFQPDALGDL